MLRSLKRLERRLECWAKLTRRSKCTQPVGILGTPLFLGQPNMGVACTPKALRELGLLKQLEAIGCDLKDYGDIDVQQPPKDDSQGAVVQNMYQAKYIAKYSEQIANAVEKVVNDGRLCVSIGGDHAAAIGTIEGHMNAKCNVSVLWVDAHADINTSATSNTGHVHGMPVALLLKELRDYWPHLPGFEWQDPRLTSTEIAYIGLRDVDHYERLIIEKFNIKTFCMEEVQKYGINEVVCRALDSIKADKNSLHVSFDIDALDYLEAPSTGTSVRGGLTLREGIHIMEEAFKSGSLSAVDIMEVDAEKGSEYEVALTMEAALFLIKAACGAVRGGIAPQGITDIPKAPK